MGTRYAFREDVLYILFMNINRLIDLVSTMHLRAVHFLQPL